MIFELGFLFGIAVAYLLLLLLAYVAERGWIPPRIARHPITYVLSLGVCATSWTYYSSVGFAQTDGYNFLTIYLGMTLALLLTPVLLMPIVRIAHKHQLTSLADRLAFRNCHQATGSLVDLNLCWSAPYLKNISLPWSWVPAPDWGCRWCITSSTTMAGAWVWTVGSVLAGP